jgi:hypothetical protein
MSEQTGYWHVVEDGKCALHGCELVKVCPTCTGVGVKMHTLDFVRERLRGEIEARQSLGVSTNETAKLRQALDALGG